MPQLKSPPSRPPRVVTLPLIACLGLITGGAITSAATIGIGDVTAKLGPTFFVDDAVIGGNDATITQPAGQSYIRSFAGLLNSNQGLTRVTLNGFGFANSSSTTNNTATSLTITFTYLGADEAVGGGDDIVMGSASGTYVYSGAGEYVFAFDTPISANLNITGARFRIQVAPSNATNNGKVLFKTGTLAYETTTGPKFSVSGSATPLRVNLAKYQTVVTDSASSQRLASYVTDGVAGNDNRWQSSGAAPHWAQVVFPYPVQVGSAQVFSGQDDGGALTSFKLQYLDNSTWIDVPGASVSGNTNVERNLVFTTPVTASSFRIYDSVDGTMMIRELALYPPGGASGYPIGTDLTVNLAQQRPVVASANTAENFALLSVDGRVNNQSMWQTSTVGANSLEIDLRVSTRIGSAHLYSGSTGISPLSDFVLRYWDGAAWQDIPGGTVAGNTAADIVIPFTSGVTTSKVRLEFNNTGTISVRELCIFPANNGGYPLGTGVTGAPTSAAKFDDFNDAFYNITNPTAGRFIAVSNGAPCLNPSGLTAAQGQYQVLLNIGTGTYRLRNRATGNCLSGAQLSSNPGDLLMDAPYSALPDQDWILDSIDGTNYYLINQWSGLVIDTQGGGTADGTPLVQNVNTGSNSQQWRMVYSANFPKKGIGGTKFATAFNACWAYNWGQATSQSLPAGAVFNPMQWGNYNWSIGSNAGPLWQFGSAWRRTSAGLHLMGFNEPDHTDQANMDVATAVMLWPRLQSMDMPLVSPAPANMTGGWLASFYTQATSLGYRVDYTPNHSYSSPNGGSSDSLISTLQTGYTTWGRPMWMTEFGFVDWSGTSSWSQEDNYNCLAEFLWRAESLSWLRKYALFVFTEDVTHPEPAQPWSAVTPGPRSNSYDINGNLTPFGELYAAWDNDAAVRANKSYYIHHKGTRKRLSNTLTSAPNAASIRTDDTSVKWTLVSAPTSGRYYVVSTRDGHRLSYVNGGSVSQAASGTAGTAVEWGLTENQYGWFYLEHPATSKRLKLAYNNSTGAATYSMVANTTTGSTVLWRFIVPPPPPTWSGTSSASWTTANNWMPGLIPSAGETVNFDSSSTANLNTTLSQDFDLLGVNVTNPSGPVSIGGTNRLTIGANGIDLSGASQNLAVFTPLVLSAGQSWNIAYGRALSVNGGLSGAFPLTFSGSGAVVLGAAMDPAVAMTVAAGGTMRTAASGVLSNAASAVIPTVNGTLDLYGTSQSVNALSGSGVVDNTSGGAGVLTVGSNNSTFTLSTLLKNTNGSLALLKTGSGSLTLTGANTFSGGFTNNGAGNIYPKNPAAFGTGPVVMNGSNIYSILSSYTIANPLTLNGALLRVGGSASHTLTWSGPVSVTAVSGINADGSTAGITLSGGLNMNDGGNTFTSFANGTANTVSSPISGGSGTIMVTYGILNLNAANTFGGTFRSSVGGPLKIGHANAMQNATLDMNAADSGSVSLNNLNATIGALTGSRNLALGNGTVTIGNNQLSTIYSGVLSGSGSLVKTGSGTLTLAGPNSYTGTTAVNGGTLALAASNVLPNTTALSIGNATLDAATFTDTVGTLDVTSTAKIHLGSGAALAFANSSAVDWTGGTLSLTGTFVSGASLRFGTSSSGLTPTQLGLISVSGFTSFALDANGYLIANAASAAPFDTWSGGAAFDADTNGDGIKNGLAWLLGATTKNTNASALLPSAAPNNGKLRMNFTCLKSTKRGSAVLKLQYSRDIGQTDAWTSHEAVVPDTSTTVNGVVFTTSANTNPDLINVQAEIPASAAYPGTTLFGRLNAVNTP